MAKWTDHSCSGCKASFFNGRFRCSLGYPVSKAGRPEEPCPKPLTYLALMDARTDKKEE